MNNKDILKILKKLNPQLFSIGFRCELSSKYPHYFCTPVGAEVFASSGYEGIHYCTLAHYGETVFVVNPEPGSDMFVYPVAGNIYDFLCLTYTLRGTSLIDQIPFLKRDEFSVRLKQCEAESAEFSDNINQNLSELKNAFDLSVISDPYEYILKVFSAFDDKKVKFSEEYYDILGLN